MAFFLFNGMRGMVSGNAVDYIDILPEGILVLLVCQHRADLGEACSKIGDVLVGFIEGIHNDDVMNAAAGIKLLFLPLAAGIAAAELLSEQWQVLAYWIPYYWTYKGNDAVLSYSASWPQILGYTLIVLALCGIVYYFLAPRIQKGLTATT